MFQPPFPEQSSTGFLNSLQLADEQFLQWLYTQNYKGIEHFVLANSGNGEDAKDLYQEAFVAVWRNVCLKKFLPETEKQYGAYLFRVARNKWIDKLRSGKTKHSVEWNDDLGETVVDEPDEDTGFYIDQVKKQYVKLGGKCQQLLGLFYFKKLSLAKIAAHFSWTEASAKNNKFRCLKQLRELVINNTEKPHE